MKTSNKILLTAFGLSLILTLIFLFYIKSNIKGIKGDGQIITEKRQVSTFTGINIKTRIKVKYTQDSLQKLIIKADNNLMKLVKTEVKNGILNIYTSKRYNIKDTILVEIVSDKINFIDLSQGSEFTGLNKITGDTITLNANSQSKINADISFKYLKSNVNSKSIINLSGNVKKLELKNISGSKFKGKNLLIENCFITAESNSKSEINVSKELNVEARGGSKVKYSGNPNMKGIDVSHGAKLQKIKEQK